MQVLLQSGQFKRSYEREEELALTEQEERHPKQRGKGMDNTDSKEPGMSEELTKNATEGDCRGERTTEQKRRLDG